MLAQTVDQGWFDLLKISPAIGVIVYLVIVFLKNLREIIKEHREEREVEAARREKAENRYVELHEAQTASVQEMGAACHTFQRELAASHTETMREMRTVIAASNTQIALCSETIKTQGTILAQTAEKLKHDRRRDAD